MSTTLIAHYMDTLIDAGVEFQVGLRGSPSPIGPAKVERVKFAAANAPDVELTIYRMLVPAQMQANQNSRPATVAVPFMFDGSDVLVILEAPLNAAGEKAVVPIATANGRTAGGLHIPGGS